MNDLPGLKRLFFAQIRIQLNIQGMSRNSIWTGECLSSKERKEHIQ